MKRTTEFDDECDGGITLKRLRASNDVRGCDCNAALELVSTAHRALLHPHQKDAVSFLLHRLLPSQLGNSDPNSLLHTGAILADDMGTGKVFDKCLHLSFDGLLMQLALDISWFDHHGNDLPSAFLQSSRSVSCDADLKLGG
jgi:hypothetical protein